VNAQIIGGYKDVKCPYLVEKSEKKVCRRMIEEGKDRELSRFDLEHYCNGKPMFCYFARARELTKPH